jgi:hypothetical protein
VVANIIACAGIEGNTARFKIVAGGFRQHGLFVIADALMVICRKTHDKEQGLPPWDRTGSPHSYAMYALPVTPFAIAKVLQSIAQDVNEMSEKSAQYALFRFQSAWAASGTVQRITANVWRTPLLQSKDGPSTANKLFALLKSKAALIALR